MRDTTWARHGSCRACTKFGSSRCQGLSRSLRRRRLRSLSKSLWMRASQRRGPRRWPSCAARPKAKKPGVREPERALLIAKPPQLRSREKKRPARTDEPDFKKLKGAVLRATIVALDALEDQGTDFTTLQKHELLELVKKQANKKSLSLRTLGTAEKYRREHPRGRSA